MEKKGSLKDQCGHLFVKPQKMDYEYFSSIFTEKVME